VRLSREAAPIHDHNRTRLCGDGAGKARASGAPLEADDGLPGGHEVVTDDDGPTWTSPDSQAPKTL
jgi:hypothetical protein